jgi:hypothetical protein
MNEIIDRIMSEEMAYFIMADLLEGDRMIDNKDWGDFD